jgi:membrane protease YdiL (CAAX protease family)
MPGEGHRMDETTKSRSEIIARRNVGGFIAVTFIISYLFGIPFNMFVSPIVKNTNEVTSVLLPRLVTVYGPAIAAVVLTSYGAGPFTVQTFLNKLTPQAKYLWWCLAIPFICLAIAFMSFSITGVSVTRLANFLVSDWHWFIFQLIGQFFIVGIGEELGWRGWLLPTLAQQRSLITCVFLTIAIWGLWHLPILFGGYQIVLPWLMMLVSLAFIMTWLWYKVNGNLFVLAIMHASFNASEVFFENRLSNAGGEKDLILAGWTTLGYVYVVIACIIVISARRIWAKTY